MYKSILGVLLGLGLGATASAFQLGEHAVVTKQAYAEFVACYPQYKDRLNIDWLVQGDQDEDLNLIEKELFFSHFYNPHKKLNLWWRGDSAARIENLQPDLLQCRADRTALTYEDTIELGHAIHHFQDMAVPAHVVPVNHSFWDGFETYQTPDGIESDWTCALIAASGAELEDILQQTAEQTLSAVQALSVEVVSTATNTSFVTDGSAFWIESNNDGFGQYGVLGNHYGETEFTENGESYRVSSDVYLSFKREQMKLAVQSTLRGLIWALKP